MSKNDDKIKSLLTSIDNKRKDLGTKPKPNWKTNAILKISGYDGVNINTVNSTDKCIKLASQILLEKSFCTEACKVLELPEQDSEQVSLLNDSLDDIKLRVKMIVWEAEKKKLQAMEKKLKDLRSTDAKTEDALDDISKTLGL